MRGGPPEEIPEDMGEESSDRDYSESGTSTVDLGFFGREVKAGDVERVEILSVDEENGTAQIKCITGEEKSEDGIGMMAAKFDEQPTEY